MHKEKRPIEVDERVSENSDNIRKLVRDAKVDVTYETGGSDIFAGMTGPRYKVGKKEIKASNLYESVLSNISDSTRNSAEQLELLHAFETAAGVFSETAYLLRSQMNIHTLDRRLKAQRGALKDLVSGADSAYEKIERETAELQKRIADASFFSNRYALYFAGHVGLAMLESEESDIEAHFSFGEDDISLEREELVKKLAETTTKKLEEIVSDKKKNGVKVDDSVLRENMRATFTGWVNQFSWDALGDIARLNGVEGVDVKYGKYSMTDGQFKKKSDVVLVDSGIMKIRRADVIGNDKYCEEVMSAMRNVCAWDHDLQKNPWSPPAAVFTFGSPGIGKTYTIHALSREIAEECREVGVPLWVFPFDIGKIASTYKDATVIKANQIIDEIIKFPGPVIAYIADADTFFPSRENPHVTPEENKLSGVLFSMFDGSRIPKGKFLPIMDANFMDKMGDALKSRVATAKLCYLNRFDKADDFARYLKGYMTKDGQETGISDEEWATLGEWVLGTELSNRELANMIGDLVGGFRINKEDLRLPTSEKNKMRVDYVKRINVDMLQEKFQSYIETTMEMEMKSREDRRRQTHDAFVADLTTKLGPETRSKLGVD